MRKPLGYLCFWWTIERKNMHGGHNSFSPSSFKKLVSTTILSSTMNEFTWTLRSPLSQLHLCRTSEKYICMQQVPLEFNLHGTCSTSAPTSTWMSLPRHYDDFGLRIQGVYVTSSIVDGGAPVENKPSFKAEGRFIPIEPL
jgi:hypothetical protein